MTDLRERVRLALFRAAGEASASGSDDPTCIMADAAIAVVLEEAVGELVLSFMEVDDVQGSLRAERTIRNLIPQKDG